MIFSAETKPWFVLTLMYARNKILMLHDDNGSRV